MTLDAFMRAISPLKNRVMMMVARGALRLADDSAKMQRVQIGVLNSETRDRCERFQDFGFTGVPVAPDDDGAAECVVLFVGGNRDHPLVIKVDDRRFRKTGMAAGESAVYNAGGEYIHLKMDGTIEVVARTLVDVTAPEVVVNASTKVTANTPLVEISGNLQVGGNITAAGDVSDADGSMQEMRDTYNGHDHTNGTAPDGTTGTPRQPMT